MLIWSAVLFVLGVLAFLDSMFNMGEIFRQVNSVVFLLVALALLVRTTTKMKEKKIEQYKNEIYQLESRIRVLEEGRRKLEEV